MPVQVARAVPFRIQPDPETTAIIRRQVTGMGADLDGFKIKIIDTCGLESPEGGDAVNHAVSAVLLTTI